MSQYITDIAVSRGPEDEKRLEKEGFTKIDVILNKDAQGTAAYFWWKKQPNVASITRIQVSYEPPSFVLKKAGYTRVSEGDDWITALTKAGYTQVSTKLIYDASLFLWYFQGKTDYDTPILELDVTINDDEEVEKLTLGWERAGCNVSSVYGKSVFLWLKREKPTYVCDVTATDFTDSTNYQTDLLQKGYIRIDQSTNSVYFWNCPVGIESFNFLWYRLCTDADNTLCDLKISTNRNQYMQYHLQGYTSPRRNLNEGSGDESVYLWWKKEKGQAQVKWMLVFLNGSAITPFENAGIYVLPENINHGSCDYPRYLCLKKNY